MGLLDPNLFTNPVLLNQLKGLLGNMPISKFIRGEEGITGEGLLGAMRAMPVFSPDAGQSAYDAAMNIGPMGLGKIVYHGSPHKFDKFDASKIGTGEGAQAYGHGVYLADSQNIANHYAEALGRGNVELGGVPLRSVREFKLPPNARGESQIISPTREVRDLAARFIEESGGDIEKAAALARRQPARTAADIEAIVRHPEVKVIPPSLYKADLPDEWIPKMLDWDKPLSEQPELRNILKSAAENTPDRFEKRLLEKAAGDKADNFWGSGAEFYRSLMAAKAQNAPAHIPLDKAEEWMGQRGASMQLNQLGIPGIRYLDGGSRGKGQGSYNYVVFPGLEDKVKILERNGVPLQGLLGGS